MDKFKLLLYTVLSMIGLLIAWVLYFFADRISKFAEAWDMGADHYHDKVMERT